MKTALLDLNILVALLWPDHEHHAIALRWFEKRALSGWATCPLTQLGFIRLVSNPAFSREALSPVHAATLLEKNIAEDRNHHFWADDLDVPGAIRDVATRIQGYRQLTDSYLVGLATRHRGVLATFDRGVNNLAGERTGAIEVVPTTPSPSGD